MPFAEITTTGKVVLLLVAGTFIVFSLVVAMAVPRRRPTFPGRRVGLFAALAAALFAAQLATVWWVTSTQEVEAAEHGEPAEPGTGPGETETAPGETETAPAETETAPGETQTEPAETVPGQGGDPAAGKAVFTSAGCGSCHTLSDAGTTGTVGPNLDAAKPSFDKVVERVTEGKPPMPSFKSQLTEQQIQDVAAYVSEATRGS